MDDFFGDKGAAAIKASSTTFEAQLKAVKTGTFTVTAASMVTKEVLATFRVTITPYQSERPDTSRTIAPIPMAYLSVDLENPFC